MLPVYISPPRRKYPDPELVMVFVAPTFVKEAPPVLWSLVVPVFVMVITPPKTPPLIISPGLEEVILPRNKQVEQLALLELYINIAFPDNVIFCAVVLPTGCVKFFNSKTP